MYTALLYVTMYYIMQQLEDELKKRNNSIQSLEEEVTFKCIL